MKVALAIAGAILVCAPNANAFTKGIVEPNPIASSVVAELGIGAQRYDLVWHGENAYTDDLVITPSVRPIVAIWGRSAATPTTQANRDTYCNFVSTVLSRYPAVKDVIVWDEVGLNYFWKDSVSLDKYTLLLRTCAPIIHSFGARMVGPGMYPITPHWAQQYIDMVKGTGLDIFDMHPYWYSDYDYDVEMVSRIRTTLGWNIPVWITEDGIQTVPIARVAHLYTGVPDGTWNGGVSEPTQAATVARNMNDARCAGISLWLNFLYKDEQNLGAWQSGLVWIDGSPKLAYQAFADGPKGSCPLPPPVPTPQPHRNNHPNDPNYRGYY